MANEFIARSGLKVLSSGIEVTGSGKFSADVTSSANIRATAFFGDGANVTGVISSSYAITSSLATNNIVTASGAGSTITFTKGDGSTFPVTIATSTAESASYITFENVANKPTLVSSSQQINTGSFTGSFAGTFTGTSSFATNASYSGLVGVPVGIVSSSGQVSYTGLSDIPTGIVSSSGQVAVLLPIGIVSSSTQINTGSFSGSFTGTLTGAASVANSVPFAGITGTPALVSASGQIDHNLTVNYVVNQHVDHSTVSITAGSGLSGGGDITTTRTLSLDTSSVHFLDGIKKELNTEGVFSSSAQLPVGTVSSSLQFNSLTSPFTGSFTGSFRGDGSGLTGVASTLSTAGTTGTGTVNLQTQTLTINGGNGITTNASGQTVTVSAPAGTVSSSIQIDVRNTTGIETIATTGSNTFTGIQTISNTTNSTVFNNGALIIEGGVGIAKDVNISGSLTITGLLTAVSTSTQYVTSSQLTVGTSRILLNDDDVVRFAGISVLDSGSSATTASLLWDSINNHWLYENSSEADYNSAIIIAGPKNYGSLGNEQELISGRIPVATGGDHIDTNLASSSIHIDFATLKTHIEAGLTVTGSITASGGFSGDGSNLTGVVSTLSVTGSQGGQSTVNLKTQGLTVTGTNGISATVSGQTLTISGSNATTTTKGVASFNSTNFTVNDGAVSSNAITFNGVPINLGNTYAYGIQNITPYGASTGDQLTLNGGAIIHGVLYTSGSASIPSPANSVVVSLSTSSYDAAHFDYVIKSGANLRTGTVFAVWQAGTSTVEFTDTSTNDIGDTLSEVFTVDVLSGNVRLKLTGDSNTWAVKTSVRMI